MAAASLLASLLVAAASPSVALAQDPPPSGCQPAGGMDLPFTTDPGTQAKLDDGSIDVVVNGGGFGHGVGMSQYGAQGAAKLGCTHPEILQTYYTGSHLGPVASERSVIRVHLRKIGTDQTTVRTTSAAAGGRPIDWTMCDYDGVTCTTVATQPAGGVWVVWPNGDGTFTLADEGVGASCSPGTDAGCHFRGTGGFSPYWGRLRLMHDGTVVRLVQVTSSAYPSGLRVKWGFTEFDHSSINGTTTYVTQYITGGNGQTAMQRYLYGLDEIPVSWEVEAHKVQAIAGASYAEATIRTRESVWDRDATGGYLEHPSGTCRCDLFKSTFDQHWTGWERENVDASGRWRAAVDATTGQYLRYDDAGTVRIAAAFYSSSHGGWSEDVKHVWGTAFSYLVPVDTSRWEHPDNSGNPFQRWSKGFTNADLAARFGLASFERMVIEHRGPGGRPTCCFTAEGSTKRIAGAVVYGRDGAGETVTKRYSGESLRSKLSTRSGLIHVGEYAPEPEPEPEPTPEPPPPVRTARQWGQSRIDTSVAVSAAGWESSEHIVIARDDNPADALAGSGLAGKYDAPLIITPPTGLAGPVRDEVKRLGATTAFVLGGEAALSPQVVADLEAAGVTTVTRLEGVNREATAARIAEHIAPEGPVERVVLVRGRFPGAPTREWPDALAVAGVTARQAKAAAPWPVLVVDDTVPQVTRDALARLKPAAVTIAGGTATVPAEVEQQLLDLGYAVDRLAGSTRWHTSRLAEGLSTESPAQVLVAATGANYPDGLSAGPLAAHLGGRLLLVPISHEANAAPWRAEEHPAWVTALGWRAPELVIIGGEGAVSAPVVDVLKASLEAGQQAAG